jgi:hypothetical protein
MYGDLLADFSSESFGDFSYKMLLRSCMIRIKEGAYMSFDILSYVREAKEEFDRTVACKHTSFDDLYPYMLEHQSFFWYKRHAAWASLLTTIRIAEGAGADWRSMFTERQLAMIDGRVLDKEVLDHWLETSQEPDMETI